MAFTRAKGKRQKGTRRPGGAAEVSTDYRIGDVVEYATNTTQEIRTVRVTCRRVILKGIAGFEGAELYFDREVSVAATGRKLWGFDYQIVRVNGELLEKWRDTAQEVPAE